MKKPILITTLALALTLTGCGNAETPHYSEVYVIPLDTCYTLGSYDDEEQLVTFHDNGVDVITLNNGRMFLSDGTYILIEGSHCPMKENNK